MLLFSLWLGFYHILKVVLFVSVCFLFVMNFMINVDIIIPNVFFWLISVFIITSVKKKKRMRAERQTKERLFNLIFLWVCFFFCFVWLFLYRVVVKPAKADVKALPRLSHSQFCYTFVHHFKPM